MITKIAHISNPEVMRKGRSRDRGNRFKTAINKIGNANTIVVR